MEKQDNLAKIINKKDEIIINLVEKMKALEEKIKGDVEIIDENYEMDTTFCNPFLRVSFEQCDFISKSSGVQVHVREKHKVINYPQPHLTFM